MGNDEYVWRWAEAPCKCTPWLVQRTICSSLRVLHPSPQLQHHLPILDKVSVQLCGLLRWPLSSWERALQSKLGPRGHLLSLAQGGTVVWSESKCCWQNSIGHQILPKVQGILQTIVLRGRALFSHHARDWSTTAHCKQECYLGWLVKGRCSSCYIWERRCHWSISEENYRRPELFVQRTAILALFPLCEEVCSECFRASPEPDEHFAWVFLRAVYW